MDKEALREVRSVGPLGDEGLFSEESFAEDLHESLRRITEMAAGRSSASEELFIDRMLKSRRYLTQMVSHAG